MCRYTVNSAAAGGGTSGYGTSLFSRGDDLDTRISDLREQISQLEASNEALSNQVYYSGAAGANNYSSGYSSNLLSV